MLIREIPAAIALIAVSFVAQTAGAQTWEREYDASLGSLPSAQGWIHFVDDPAPADGLTESNYGVAANVLTQGPTGGPNADDANRQWYEAAPFDVDFDHDVVEVDLRLRVVSSTISTGGASPRAGFGVQVSDSGREAVALYIGASSLFLYGRDFTTPLVVSYNSTAAFKDYRLRVDSRGAAILLDPDTSGATELAWLPRADFAATSGADANRMRIGDLATSDQSHTELERFRLARSTPPTAEIRNVELVTTMTTPADVASVLETAVCPANKTAVGGGARILGPLESATLLDSRPAGIDGWFARARGPFLRSLQLRVDVICGEVPNLRWLFDSDFFASTLLGSSTASCPGSQALVGGSAEIFDFRGLQFPIGLRAAEPLTAAGASWEASAAFDLTGGDWQLSTLAGCSDAHGWIVRSESTATDLVTPKSIGATCPVGTVAIGGGARVIGTADAALTGSYPEALFTPGKPVAWVAVAEEFGWYNPLGSGGPWGLEATVVCAPTAEPTVAKREIAGRWRADSTFPIDERGANDGTLENGATIVPGLLDQAFSFERVNEEWLSIPGEDFYPEGSFTVDAFFQTDSLAPGDSTVIASLYDLGGINAVQANFSSWSILLTPQGYASGALRPAAFGSSVGVTGTEPLGDGEPHHVALVRDVEDTRTLALYVDGELVGTDPLTLNVTDAPLFPSDAANPDPISIGIQRAANSPSLTREFEGLIDDVKFYDRALTPEEIENIAGCGVFAVPRVLNLDAVRFGGAAGTPDDHRLCVRLEAGSYIVELVSPATNPEARFTAWSPDEAGQWGTAYSAVGEVDPGISGGLPIGEASAQDAFDNTATKAVTLTLTTAQRVYFGFVDDAMLDNRGGVSLSISVPEPAAGLGLAAGTLTLTLLGAARRRSRGSAPSRERRAGRR